MVERIPTASQQQGNMEKTERKRGNRDVDREMVIYRWGDQDRETV